MSTPPRERVLRRDRPDSSFSHILNRFLVSHQEALAAVLVDGDGECVDYASELEPYDAQIFGATLLAATASLAVNMRRLGAGAPIQWVVEAARYDLVVRRLGDDFVLVVVLAAQGLSGHVLSAMVTLAEALRTEAGLEPELWDPASVQFRVLTRRGPAGDELPAQLQQGTRTIPVDQIVGRWTERGLISSAQRMCFRVRAGQDELTLVYEPELGRWYRR